MLLAPALIGLMARAGARLPLSGRLAVRDAERHRRRTGPATSAIVAAVTGSVVLAFLLAGAFRADELRYAPQLPPHTRSVMAGDGPQRAMLQAADLAAAKLPGARTHPVTIPLGPAPRDSAEVSRQLYADQQPGACPETSRSHDCGGTVVEAGRNGSVAIGAGDATTRLLAGPGFDAAARAALAGGKALAFGGRMLDAKGDADNHPGQWWAAVATSADGSEQRIGRIYAEREADETGAYVTRFILLVASPPSDVTLRHDWREFLLARILRDDEPIAPAYDGLPAGTDRQANEIPYVQAIIELRDDADAEGE